MKTIDLEQRRYEIAKEVLPFALSISFGAKTHEEDKDLITSYAVDYADALIEKLKAKEDKTMSKQKAIKYIKDSLLEIPDIDADRGYPALMRVKENLNETLKELEG